MMEFCFRLLDCVPPTAYVVNGNVVLLIPRSSSIISKLKHGEPVPQYSVSKTSAPLSLSLSHHTHTLY